MAKFKSKFKSKKRRFNNKDFLKFFLVSFIALSMIFSTVAYLISSNNNSSLNSNVVFDDSKGMFVFEKNNKNFYSFAPLYNYNLQYNVSFYDSFFNSDYFLLSRNYSEDKNLAVISYVLLDNVNRGFNKNVGSGFLDKEPLVNCSLASDNVFVLELVNSSQNKVEFENNCLKLYYSSFEDLAVESSFFTYKIFKLI